jgi:hypothetical protein
MFRRQGAGFAPDMFVVLCLCEYLGILVASATTRFARNAREHPAENYTLPGCAPVEPRS